jgi:tetratricopeptide (TPR) repeat protein
MRPRNAGRPRFERTTVATLLAALIAAVVTSCAGSTTTRRPNPEETTREDAETYSSKTTLFTDKHEAALDVARGYRRDGHYAEALAAFRALYEDTSADARYREQALFDLAQLTGSPLNPKRDNAAAIKLFEQFLAEYPDSEEAARAREQLEALRSAPTKP